MLGILAEGDKHPFTTLFDYHASDGQVQLADITKQFAPIVAADCTATFGVVGVTERGWFSS